MLFNSRASYFETSPLCFGAELRGPHADVLSKHRWGGRRKGCVNVTDVRRSRTLHGTVVGQTQMPWVVHCNWIFPPRLLHHLSKAHKACSGVRLFWESVWLKLYYVLITRSGYNAVKISIEQYFLFNVIRVSVPQFCWRTRVPLIANKSRWRAHKQRRAFTSPSFYFYYQPLPEFKEWRDSIHPSNS